MGAMRIGLALCLLLATSAVAGGRKPVVVVSGPPPVLKWLGKELSKKATVRAARSEVSDMPMAKEVREATTPDGAIALLLCQNDGQALTIRVLSGADGTPLGMVQIRVGKKLPKSFPKADLAELLAAIQSGQAPGAPPPPAPAAAPVEPTPAPAPVATTTTPAAKPAEPAKPVETKPAEPAPKPTEPARAATVTASPESPSTVPARPAVYFSVGGGGFNRRFGWSGNPSTDLAVVDLPFSGSVSVDATWFPGSHVTTGVLANLGVYGSADIGLGVVSGAETSRFAHTATRLRFGAIGRLPIGDRLTLALHAGYARQQLSTSQYAVNDGSPRPYLPDVLFNGLRGGLSFRIRIVGTLELDGSGGAQMVSGMGELKSERYFPKASAFGVDAGGGLSMELAEHIRLRLGGEWNTYFVTLHPQEGATFYAESLKDQYITATASLQWVM